MTSQTPTLPTHAPGPVGRLETPLPEGATLPPADTNSSMSKAPPCLYVVIRAGGTPERFQADDDAQALERLQKEVRAGQIPAVFCYKLMCAEFFVPSSSNMMAEELINNKRKANDE